MESRELQALAEIWRKGGQASIGALARAMRINSDYARVILLDVGKKDYIDVKRGGMCKITQKGKDLLKSRGILTQLDQEKKEEEGQAKARAKIEKKGKEGSKTISFNY